MTAKMRLNLCLISSALLTSSVVSAHPGHDHSHWTSEPMHMLFYGAVALAGTAATVWAIKAKRKETTKEREQ